MILSDVIRIPFKAPLESEQIEKYLTDNYGEIIRWAIIEIAEDKLKVCFSYVKP